MEHDDGKLKFKNEGNVVIIIDLFYYFNNKNDIFRNIFNETHAYESSSSKVIINTNLVYELE
jgi:hypothetical protein